MRWPFRRKPRGPVAMRRRFVTPEGVDLGLELAGAGARAAAFLLDELLLVILLVTATIALVSLAESKAMAEFFTIIWLIGFFFLRNGWFILFEMGARGATPGKRALGLRVVARDGARLTGGAVVARNAMREIEVFLPLSFLGAQAAGGAADAFLTLFALGWSGVFLFFPLTNRDRLRVGDLVAGTWVVQTSRATLGADLSAADDARPRRVFSERALDLYGVYELQTLEEVLRLAHPKAMATVADAIRRKAGIADDGDDAGFLTDYYAGLCLRLEREAMVGRRRESKSAGAGTAVETLSNAPRARVRHKENNVYSRTC